MLAGSKPNAKLNATDTKGAITMQGLILDRLFIYFSYYLVSTAALV
jgi:hypothetical protein